MAARAMVVLVGMITLQIVGEIADLYRVTVAGGWRRLGAAAP